MVCGFPCRFLHGWLNTFVNWPLCLYYETFSKKSGPQKEKEINNKCDTITKHPCNSYCAFSLCLCSNEKSRENSSTYGNGCLWHQNVPWSQTLKSKMLSDPVWTCLRNALQKQEYICKAVLFSSTVASSPLLWIANRGRSDQGTMCSHISPHEEVQSIKSQQWPKKPEKNIPPWDNTIE